MENKFKVWTLRAAAILFVLVLGTTVMCSGLFARFVSFATGGDSARVAKFDFKVSEIMFESQDGSVSNVVDFYTGPGGHEFKVSPGMTERSSWMFFEYHVVNDSEVTVELTAVAQRSSNIPFRVYFLDIKDPIQDPTNTDSTQKRSQKIIQLAPGKSRTFYLWLDWANPNGVTEWDKLFDYKYSSEIEQLTVTLDCRQVD